MASVPGIKPPSLTSLARVEDRLSFLYVEHCVVNRDSNAVTITDKSGTVHVPAAQLSVLMLGPGSSVTHAAMSLIAESRATCIWVGEQGVRYYCHGASLSRSTRLLEAQAKLVSSERSRLKVARRMYEMRFPGENTAHLTMQQLLGKEGTRVGRAYMRESERTGVPWHGRSYKVEDFESSDTVNKALSAVNTSLYGVVHAVIVALGCSPGLGFVHARNERSFVYDIADLYKVEITIPLAFDLAAQEPADIGVAARRAIRDRMRSGRFMQRCVHDIKYLLTGGDAGNEGPRSLAQHPPQKEDGWAVGARSGGQHSGEGSSGPRQDFGNVDETADGNYVDGLVDEEGYRNELILWAGRRGMVPAGRNYSSDATKHTEQGTHVGSETVSDVDAVSERRVASLTSALRSDAKATEDIAQVSIHASDPSQGGGNREFGRNPRFGKGVDAVTDTSPASGSKRESATFDDAATDALTQSGENGSQDGCCFEPLDPEFDDLESEW